MNADSALGSGASEVVGGAWVERGCGGRVWFSPRSVFVLAFGVAMAFAFATDRVWEDFYITFKSSKHLVEGKGLVFHEGEKVHTFTSPLGVLLPAFCYWVTGGHSEAAAIWAFRFLSVAAFAGGVALLYGAALKLRWHPAAAGFLALGLMTDAKSVDFSINGMETGLLLGCVAWILRTMLVPGRRAWLSLGLAWAALMWTRPDGFVYVAALALGGWVFTPQKEGRPDRWSWIRTCLLAGLVCTAVYLPWFLTAWWYYGSPVPHTVVAKGNAAGVKTLWGALQAWFWVHGAWFKNVEAVEALFMPAGYFYRGWPEWLPAVSRGVGGLAVLLWWLPGLTREVRAVALALSLVLAYLDYFPPVLPYGWYLPGPAWMAIWVMAGGLNELSKRGAVGGKLAWAMAGFGMLLSGWLLVEVARLSKVEQVHVDDGNRREVGLWLKANAQPGDSVFMECLGYLGYFSGLKTFDYPGMSSPEVVQASQKVGLEWPALIEELKPTWLVLRPLEASRIARARPGLLTEKYEEVKVFDASPRVERLRVRGHGLLAFDCQFLVFRRKAP